jgi:hypothetical protein
MDPNLFHLDWERLGEVLAGVVVMAFLIERALSLLFGNEHYIRHFKDKHVKELIAFAVSVFVCWYWDFDALSMIFLKDQTALLGFVITGGVVAGGSKGAMKLFQDVMGFKTDAQKRLESAAEGAGKQVTGKSAGKKAEGAVSA